MWLGSIGEKNRIGLARERARDSLSGVGGDIAHSGRLRLSEKCGSESAISDRPARSRGRRATGGEGEGPASRRVASARPALPLVTFRRFVVETASREGHRQEGAGRAEREVGSKESGGEGGE